MLNNKTILITGGTGSFGKKILEMILDRYNPHRIIIYSRDEYKQSVMKAEYSKKYDMSKVRFFIGDVRDKDRLYRAFDHVDYVIHAAAMKQVPTCEYNPFEAIKTNIHGAQNVIDAAIDRGVKKVVALSTDKAVNPINLYGGTKLVSDKLFITANAYSKISKTKFSVVRYGNVAGSRGSIIPIFKNIIDNGGNELPITDMRMTRFWITLEQGVELVFKAMLPGCKIKEIGIREGEKLHEVMVTKDDCRSTYEFDKHYIIYPHFEWWDESRNDRSGGKLVEDGFEYSSANNSQWLSVEQIREQLKKI